jgi:integrase
MLLTGARRGSVEALRWRDVDLDRGLIHFSTAKAGRTYSVPACAGWWSCCAGGATSATPDAEWVFESPQKPGRHVIAASARRQARRGERASLAAHLPNNACATGLPAG